MIRIGCGQPEAAWNCYCITAVAICCQTLILPLPSSSGLSCSCRTGSNTDEHFGRRKCAGYL